MFLWMESRHLVIWLVTDELICFADDFDRENIRRRRLKKSVHRTGNLFFWFFLELDMNPLDTELLFLRDFTHQTRLHCICWIYWIHCVLSHFGVGAR